MSYDRYMDYDYQDGCYDDDYQDEWYDDQEDHPDNYDSQNPSDVDYPEEEPYDPQDFEEELEEPDVPEGYYEIMYMKSFAYCGDSSDDFEPEEEDQEEEDQEEEEIEDTRPISEDGYRYVELGGIRYYDLSSKKRQ